MSPGSSSSSSSSLTWLLLLVVLPAVSLAIPLFESCNNNDDCTRTVPNSMCSTVPDGCGQGQKICQCVSGYRHDGTSKCLKEARLDQACGDGVLCADTSSQCVASRCECLDGYRRDPLNPRQCLSELIRSQYGQMCRDSVECDGTQECVDKKCVCLAGYVYSPSIRTCREINIGDPCKSNDDCLAVFNAVCAGEMEDSKVCACETGYLATPVSLYGKETRLCLSDSVYLRDVGQPCVDELTSETFCKPNLICSQCPQNAKGSVCMRPMAPTTLGPTLPPAPSTRLTTRSAAVPSSTERMSSLEKLQAGKLMGDEKMTMPSMTTTSEYDYGDDKDYNEETTKQTLAIRILTTPPTAATVKITLPSTAKKEEEPSTITPNYDDYNYDDKTTTKAKSVRTAATTITEWPTKPKPSTTATVKITLPSTAKKEEEPTTSTPIYDDDNYDDETKTPEIVRTTPQKMTEWPTKSKPSTAATVKITLPSTAKQEEDPSTIAPNYDDYNYDDKTTTKAKSVRTTPTTITEWPTKPKTTTSTTTVRTAAPVVATTRRQLTTAIDYYIIDYEDVSTTRAKPATRVTSPVPTTSQSTTTTTAAKTTKSSTVPTTTTTAKVVKRTITPVVAVQPTTTEDYDYPIDETPEVIMSTRPKPQQPPGIQRVQLGLTCAPPSIACETVNAACIASRCQCISGYEQLGANFCHQIGFGIPLGKPCDEDDDCATAGASCVNATCQCPAGFKGGKKNDCIEVKRTALLDGSCSHSTECYYGLSCIRYKCQCVPGTKNIGNYDCAPRVFGEPCPSGFDRDCKFIKEGVCRQGSCQCREGWMRKSPSECTEAMWQETGENIFFQDNKLKCQRDDNCLESPAAPKRSICLDGMCQCPQNSKLNTGKNSCEYKGTFTDEGNACIKSSDCRSPGLICFRNTCSYRASIMSSTSCNKPTIFSIILSFAIVAPNLLHHF